MNRRAVLSFLVVGSVGFVIWVAGCSDAPPVWTKPEPHILVSVPPLYSFAKSVAGEHGEVQCLCKETGPHHFDNSDRDMRLLNGATRFFTVGLGLDDKFSDKMFKASDKKSATDVYIKLGEKLDDKLKLEGEHDEKDAGHAHKHQTDPHVWLGNKQAIAMVEMIRDELKKADPKNKDAYDKNAKAYIEELEKLKKEGDELLKHAKERKIISFHESLGYFAKDFDIDIVDVIEEGPGDEPGSKKMNDLIARCKEHKVRLIAVEPQYPTTGAATVLTRELKREGIEVKLVEIDPLETASEKDLSAGLYIKVMRENLENLSKALK
jgi:ABC-type Zn uptake system ZnuABC Zn-binding protein ZnuA